MSTNEIDIDDATATVTVGSDGPDSLNASTTSLESPSGKAIRVIVENDGTPAHVHCRLDGELGELLTLEQSNYYVEADGETMIFVPVPNVPHDISGSLELSTGYGATAVTLDVTVTGKPEPIAVDETLGEPKRDEPEPTGIEAFAQGIGLEAGTLAVLALGVVAIAVAGTTAAIVGGPAAVGGVVAVTIGLLVALWLLFYG